MNLILHIPDDLAERLGVDGDLDRQALEALAVEAFRAGRLEKPDIRRLLGFTTRYALDGFLKQHGLFETFTADDVEKERQDLERLGF
jgi:hypothetical protein